MFVRPVVRNTLKQTSNSPSFQNVSNLLPFGEWERDENRKVLSLARTEDVKIRPNENSSKGCHLGS